MPKIAYADAGRITPLKQQIIDRVNAIVSEYKGQGYDLSLRQVYYQFVARDWLPQEWADTATGSTNNVRSYDKLGVIVGDGRMWGLIDWTAIVDRMREMDGNTHWTSPASIVDAVARQYMIDKWEGQDYRPEVWVEKDALEGVVGKACRATDVPFFSCRGYTSLSSIWENAQRLREVVKKGAIPVILHLGDHDPSGIDMTRDIKERVRLFMGSAGRKLAMERIALNMPQVEQYQPPENPAKVTDSRYASYEALYGQSSWELDALEPAVLDGIIQDNVAKFRNDAQFDRLKRREDTERGLLARCSDRWDDVADMLEEDDDA